MWFYILTSRRTCNQLLSKKDCHRRRLSMLRLMSRQLRCWKKLLRFWILPRLCKSDIWRLFRILRIREEGRCCSWRWRVKSDLHLIIVKYYRKYEFSGRKQNWLRLCQHCRLRYPLHQSRLLHRSALCPFQTCFCSQRAIIDLISLATNLKDSVNFDSVSITIWGTLSIYIEIGI